MKKLLSVLFALLVLASSLCLTAFAANAADPIWAYVTISNKGELAVCAEKVYVTDNNEDGSITIDEALYAAHEKYYTGGATGYSSAVQSWGLSITKLWGDISGNFIYYLNDRQVETNLSKAIVANDYICAYVLKDDIGWSDAYSYFDKKTVDTKIGEEVTLELSVSSFDTSWNEVFLPLADATITVNGTATEYKTDSEGKVTVKFDKDGKYVVSATTDAKVIVPPVCVVTVPEDTTDKNEIKADETKTEIEDKIKTEIKPEQKADNSPKTGDSVNIYFVLAFVCLAFAAVILKKNTSYEK